MSTRILEYLYITQTKKLKKIQVNLINSDFVEIWIKYIINLSKKLPTINWYMAVTNNMVVKKTPASLIISLYHLYKAFYFININKIDDFSKELDEILHLISYPENLDQQHLNKWHRYFTSLEYKFLNLETPVPETVDKNKLFSSIQDINKYTHIGELYTYFQLKRRNEFEGLTQYSVQFTDANNLNYINEGVFDEPNIEWIPDYLTYNLFEHDNDFDVWLHEHITGKDQMKAWLEEDDLCKDDITGNKLMTPAITFDPHMIYKKVLDNNEFRQESKNSKKLLNRFPLGNIKDKSEIDWEEFNKSRIVYITLDKTLLWKNKL